MSRRFAARLAHRLCVAAASLLLAACGGSSPSSTSSAAKEQQAEVRFADFAKCLREHGIEATSAAGPGGQGHGLRIKGVCRGPAKMEAAQKACKKYQPEPQKLNLSPQEKVARAEAVEKFAKCMREHGIEVHASSSEGRVSIQIHAKAGAAVPTPKAPPSRKRRARARNCSPSRGRALAVRASRRAGKQSRRAPGSSIRGKQLRDSGG